VTFAHIGDLVENFRKRKHFYCPHNHELKNQNRHFLHININFNSCATIPLHVDKSFPHPTSATSGYLSLPTLRPRPMGDCGCAARNNHGTGTKNFLFSRTLRLAFDAFHVGVCWWQLGLPFS
jgi:hypothetical protein